MRTHVDAATTRRTSRPLALTVALVAGFVLAGCAQSSTDTGSSAAPATPSGTAAAGTVRVLLSGDTNVKDLWDKGIVPGFTKANPTIAVQINLDLHGEHDAQNAAKLAAAVRANRDPGTDLIDAGFVTQVAQAGLLEPPTTENIPNLKDVAPDVVTAGGGGGIPYRGSSVLLAYNPDKVVNPPKTLDELLAWIKANKGRFTYNSPKSGGSGQSFVTTVLDKYVPADSQQKLRTSYAQAEQTHWEQGFAELKGLNPFIYNNGFYPNGNKQSLELLASGQIWMCPVWSDMFIDGQKTGLIPAGMKVTQISNPSFTGGAAYLGVPKNSPNKEAALKLADYLLIPDAQNAIATTIAGYPVIPLDKLPAQTQEVFKDAHPETLRPTYFSQVANDLNQQWDEKVPGK